MKKTMMILAALSLACILAVGSTMSYLTYTDYDVNTMVVGNVKIDQLEQKRNGDAFVDEVKLLPVTSTATEEVAINGTNYQLLSTAKNAVDKIVTVQNTGSEDAYVRTLFAFEMLNNGDGTWSNPFAGNLKMVANGDYMTDVTFEKNGTQYIVGVCTYADALVKDEVSAPSLLQIYLDSAEEGAFYKGAGASYEILVLSQAVQAAGFGSASEALDAAFGAVDAANAATWFAGVNAA